MLEMPVTSTIADYVCMLPMIAAQQEFPEPTDVEIDETIEGEADSVTRGDTVTRGDSVTRGEIVSPLDPTE